jgi:hypothetical protein
MMKRIVDLTATMLLDERVLKPTDNATNALALGHDQKTYLVLNLGMCEPCSTCVLYPIIRVATVPL